MALLTYGSPDLQPVVALALLVVLLALAAAWRVSVSRFDDLAIELEPRVAQKASVGFSYWQSMDLWWLIASDKRVQTHPELRQAASMVGVVLTAAVVFVVSAAFVWISIGAFGN